MTRLFIALAIAALILTSATAQDAKKKPAAKKGGKAAKKKAAKVTPPAVKAFQAVRKEFDKVNKDIRAIIDKYRAARNKPDERRVLLIEYRSLVKKAQSSFDRLVPAAQKAYEAAPNQFDDVTYVMVGIANDHIGHDRFTEAQRILDMMIAKKGTHRALHPLSGRAAYCLNQFDKAEKHFQAAEKLKIPLSFEDQAFQKDIPVAKKKWKREQELRAKEKKANDLPQVTIETNKGSIVIELYENEAPETVGNFIALATQKKEDGAAGNFYDNLKFHRVIGGFMAQTGCPQGTGSGDPGYSIYCECVKKNHRHHFRGSLSMAKGTPINTGGSQFFITFRRTAHLDGKHTVFGRVIKGMDVVDKIQRGDPITGQSAKPDYMKKVTVTRKRKGSTYKPKKVPLPKPESDKKGKKKK